MTESAYEDVDVDAVIKVVLRRTASPRAESHADELAHTAVKEQGRESVAKCIRLIIADGLTHRRAGAAAFGAEDYLDGITVGSAVSIYLHRDHQITPATDRES